MDFGSTAAFRGDTDTATALNLSLSPSGSGRAYQPQSNLRDIASQYTAAKDDANLSAKQREAAKLFSTAEGCVDKAEDLDEAIKTAQSARQLFEEADDKAGVVNSMRLGALAREVKAHKMLNEKPSNKKEAEEVLQEAEQIVRADLETYRSAGTDNRGIAALLLSIAELHLSRHNMNCLFDLEEAEKSTKQAQNLLENVGDAGLEARTWQALGWVYLKKQEPNEAIEAAKRSADMFEGLRDQHSAAMAKHLLGTAHIQSEQVVYTKYGVMRGLDCFKTSVRTYEALGQKRWAANELYNLAHMVLMFLDKPMMSLDYALQAQKADEELGNTADWVLSLELVVHGYLALREPQQALAVAKAGLARYADSESFKLKPGLMRTVIHAHIGMEQFEEAEEVAEEALKLLREFGSQEDLRNMTEILGILCRQRENYDRSAEILGEAQELCQKADDVAAEAHVLNLLIDTAIATKDFKDVVRLANEQRELYIRMNNKRMEAVALLTACHYSACGCGEKDELLNAVRLADEAQTMAKEANDQKVEACAWQQLVRLHLRTGEPARALACGEFMLELFQEVGDKACVAHSYCELAHVQLALEQPEKAVDMTRQARSILKDVPAPSTRVELLITTAEMYFAVANQEGLAAAKKNAQKFSKERSVRSNPILKAYNAAEEARSLARKLKSVPLVASSLYMLARVSMKYNVEDAMKTASAAKSAFNGIEDKVGEGITMLLIAEIHLKKGRKGEALDMCNQTIDLAKQAKQGDLESDAANLLDQIQSTDAKYLQYEMDEPMEMLAMAESAAVVEKKPAMDPAVALTTIMGCAQRAVAEGDELAQDVPLMESGMDSLAAVAFRNELSKDIGMNMPASLVFDYPSIRGIVDYVVERSAS